MSHRVWSVWTKGGLKSGRSGRLRGGRNSDLRGTSLGQIKKYLVSVTLSQIFRGGRAFFNIYSFF
jgi:hypothetical protein